MESRLTLAPPRRPLLRYLMYLAFFVALNGCGSADGGGSPEAYIENNVMWAYGAVQVADLDGPPTLMLAKTDGQGLNSSRWQLYGRYQPGDVRDLAYADFHPYSNVFLAYSYQIYVVPRYRTSGVYDVYALLKKAGRSFFCRQKVYLGAARFAPGATEGALTPAPGLKVSLIANGVFAGQWAMHYPNVRKVEVKPWQGLCAQFMTQAPGQVPGQNPGQNPGQFENCRPLPPEHDLCNGDPTRPGCRPAPPKQVAPPPGAPAIRQLAQDLQQDGENVYLMSAETQEAKMVFVSSTVSAVDDETNAAICTRSFFAVGRTVDGRINPACVLKPAPAFTQDGRLACGVSVRFQNAQTYLERVCNVTAVFHGDDIPAEELQQAQILKR